MWGSQLGSIESIALAVSHSAAEHEHEHHDDDEAERAAGVVAPTLAVRPRRDGAQQYEDQDDEHDSSERHGRIPCFGCMAGLLGRRIERHLALDPGDTGDFTDVFGVGCIEITKSWGENDGEGFGFHGGRLTERAGSRHGVITPVN